MGWMQKLKQKITGIKEQIEDKQRLFSFLAQEADEVYILYDTKKKQIEYVSPNVSSLLGVNQDEMQKDIKILTKLGCKISDKLDEIEVRLKVGDVWDSKEELVHQITGELLFLEYKIYKLPETRKLALILRDRSKERKQKNALESEIIAVNKANHEKSKFLITMSHDIRTPMNTIMGLTAIAEKHLDDKDRLIDSLNKISASSIHLLNLINDILDLSRIESGKNYIQQKLFCLSDLIDNLYTILLPQINAKKQKFHIDAEMIEHKYLVGDVTRLKQICINILSNSVKFTNEYGNVYFSVREIKTLRQGYARFILVFQDDGIGMHPEFIEHIFVPFERDNRYPVTQEEGNGLGMAIVKNIIDTMNGIITVESVVDKGSVFTVSVDLKIGQEFSTDVNASKANNADKHLVKDGLEIDRRVLLVEDNLLNLEIANELLQNYGLTVFCAENGLDALELYKNSEEGYFSLIFMDIQMPVMDGYTSVTNIRKLNRADTATIPIVAMTANAFQEDRNACLLAGMNDHIAKPLDLKELENILLKYLPSK